MSTNLKTNISVSIYLCACLHFSPECIEYFHSPQEQKGKVQGRLEIFETLWWVPAFPKKKGQMFGENKTYIIKYISYC